MARARRRAAILDERLARVLDSDRFLLFLIPFTVLDLADDLLRAFE